MKRKYINKLLNVIKIENEIMSTETDSYNDTLFVRMKSKKTGFEMTKCYIAREADDNGINWLWYFNIPVGMEYFEYADKQEKNDRAVSTFLVAFYRKHMIFFRLNRKRKFPCLVLENKERYILLDSKKEGIEVNYVKGGKK